MAMFQVALGAYLRKNNPNASYGDNGQN